MSFSFLTTRSFIRSLLLPSCPSAISGIVVAVVILTFNGVLWRTCPHVLLEVLERFPPPLADLNAPCTIKVIFLILRVVTPTNHSPPHNHQWSIFWRMLSPCLILRTDKFCLQAPATVCVSLHQLPRSHLDNSSAVTTACPHNVSILPIWSGTKHQQSTKHLPGQFPHNRKGGRASTPCRPVSFVTMSCRGAL